MCIYAYRTPLPKEKVKVKEKKKKKKKKLTGEAVLDGGDGAQCRQLEDRCRNLPAQGIVAQIDVRQLGLHLGVEQRTNGTGELVQMQLQDLQVGQGGQADGWRSG